MLWQWRQIFSQNSLGRYIRSLLLRSSGVETCESEECYVTNKVILSNFLMPYNEAVQATKTCHMNNSDILNKIYRVVRSNQDSFSELITSQRLLVGRPCSMSKVSKLLQKYNTWMSMSLSQWCLFAYSVTKTEIMLHLTRTHGFFAIFTQHAVKRQQALTQRVKWGIFEIIDMQVSDFFLDKTWKLSTYYTPLYRQSLQSYQLWKPVKFISDHPAACLTNYVLRFHINIIHGIAKIILHMQTHHQRTHMLW